MKKKPTNKVTASKVKNPEDPRYHLCKNKNNCFYWACWQYPKKTGRLTDPGVLMIKQGGKWVDVGRDFYYPDPQECIRCRLYSIMNKNSSLEFKIYEGSTTRKVTLRDMEKNRFKGNSEDWDWIEDNFGPTSPHLVEPKPNWDNEFPGPDPKDYLDYLDKIREWKSRPGYKEYLEKSRAFKQEIDSFGTLQLKPFLFWTQAKVNIQKCFKSREEIKESKQCKEEFKSLKSRSAQLKRIDEQDRENVKFGLIKPRVPAEAESYPVIERRIVGNPGDPIYRFTNGMMEYLIRFKMNKAKASRLLFKFCQIYHFIPFEELPPGFSPQSIRRNYLRSPQN